MSVTGFLDTLHSLAEQNDVTLMLYRFTPFLLLLFAVWFIDVRANSDTGKPAKLPKSA